MSSTKVHRHKTAIRRGDFSRPVKCLLRDCLLTKGVTFFDYGCGRGEDLELLATDGIVCAGWDPAYRPDGDRREADVVNLGYVLNVIEEPGERAETLRRAWGLCREVPVVAAQVLVGTAGRAPVEYEPIRATERGPASYKGVPPHPQPLSPGGARGEVFGDGVLTGRGTFQKYFEQAELKAYLEEQLSVEAVPAGIGTFYLFKDETRKQQFLANRFRRREILPRRRIAELRLAETRQALEPLMEAIATLGRLPEADEFAGAAAVVEQFGSLKRAFAVARRITDDDTWDAIARRRREDLLVYLALSRFGKRLPFGRLPRSLQRDMRAFFGSYMRACADADALLFQAGDASAVDAACARAAVGKLLPDDLYVHASAVDCLEPVLRIYEGCGRTYLGEVDGANVVKIHRRTGKLSYLVYPEFDRDPHPALARVVRLNLRTRQIDCQDYRDRANPPVLHRKETFLRPDDERRAKFARLTAQEEKHGLLAETSTIGTREGWARRLSERGFALRGHRLVRLG